MFCTIRKFGREGTCRPHLHLEDCVALGIARASRHGQFALGDGRRPRDAMLQDALFVSRRKGIAGLRKLTHDVLWLPPPLLLQVLALSVPLQALCGPCKTKCHSPC